MRVCSCYVQKCVAQLSYVQKCFSQFDICGIRPKVRQYVQKCVSSGSYVQKCASRGSYVQKCVSSGSLRPKVRLAPRKPNPPARPKTNRTNTHICRLLQPNAGSKKHKQLLAMCPSWTQTRCSASLLLDGQFFRCRAPADRRCSRRVWGVRQCEPESPAGVSQFLTAPQISVIASWASSPASSYVVQLSIMANLLSVLAVKS